MELNNTPQVSDEARRLAEAKRITVQPLHTDVAPDAEPEAEAVARHVNGPAIGNVSNDTEQTAPLLQPSQEVLHNAPEQPQPKSHLPLAIVTTSLVGAGALGVLLFVVLF